MKPASTSTLRASKALKHINTSNLPARSIPQLPYVPTPLTVAPPDLSAFISLTCVAFDRLQIVNAHIDSLGGLDHCATSLADESDDALTSLLTHLETLARHLGWARILDYRRWFQFRSPSEHALMGSYLAMVVDAQGPVDDEALMPAGDVAAGRLVRHRELGASQTEAVRATEAAFAMYVDHFVNEWVDELEAAKCALLDCIYVLSRVVGLDVLLGLQWFDGPGATTNAGGGGGEREGRGRGRSEEEMGLMRLMIAHHVWLRVSSWERTFGSVEQFVYAGEVPPQAVGVGLRVPAGGENEREREREREKEREQTLSLTEELDRNLALMDTDPNFKFPV